MVELAREQFGAGVGLAQRGGLIGLGLGQRAAALGAQARVDQREDGEAEHRDQR